MKNGGEGLYKFRSENSLSWGWRTGVGWWLGLDLQSPPSGVGQPHRVRLQQSNSAGLFYLHTQQWRQAGRWCHWKSVYCLYICYTIHYYYPCPQVCCIIQELQVLLLSSIIHSSNIFKVIIKVFVGHREGIYGEGLQSVQALVKSFALNIPNWVVFTEWLNTHPIFCAKFRYTKQNDLHVSSPLCRP